jgi:hypothetical protein
MRILLIMEWLWVWVWVWVCVEGGRRGKSSYEGRFEEDSMHGVGTMNYGNGNTYTGQWQKGLPWGSGTMTFANGDMHRGLFVRSRHLLSNHVTRGYGEMTVIMTFMVMTMDGGVLVFVVVMAQQASGKCHGRGTRTFGNRAAPPQNGDWVEDKFFG